MLNLFVAAEWLGAIAAIVGALSFFYRKIDKQLLTPIKKHQEEISSLKEWIATQQEDIADNRECTQMLIVAMRASLDGHMQKGCNGKVTEAARLVDDYILSRGNITKSKTI